MLINCGKGESDRGNSCVQKYTVRLADKERETVEELYSSVSIFLFSSI